METWEIDPLAMSIRDYIVLARGTGPGWNPEELRETLGRLVTNKTEEEIEVLSIRDLNTALAGALEAFQDLAFPKKNATPS